MESGSAKSIGGAGAETAFDLAAGALAHFARGLFGVGDGKNLLWLGVFPNDEPTDALHQHSGLAGSRARADKHWTTNMSCGKFLFRIENPLRRLGHRVIMGEMRDSGNSRFALEL